MAKSGGSRGRPARQANGKGRAAASRTPKPAPRAKPKPPAPEPVVEPAVGPLVLGAIPGATPGKWIDTWKSRHPDAPLELHPLEVQEQRTALAEGIVDAALVRLPIERDGLHVIPLYDELPVVVVGAESHLTAADELDLADLAGEIVVTPRDDVLAVTVPGALAPRFAAPADTAEAIATVAAGVGVVLVPMSLARLHHRKDVAVRPLRDGPTSTVALAWVSERTTPAVDAFVGIVRGRTANSSRG